jgi:hypothetical protein
MRDRNPAVALADKSCGSYCRNSWRGFRRRQVGKGEIRTSRRVAPSSRGARGPTPPPTRRTSLDPAYFPGVLNRFPIHPATGFVTAFPTRDHRKTRVQYVARVWSNQV